MKSRRRIIQKREPQRYLKSIKRASHQLRNRNSNDKALPWVAAFVRENTNAYVQPAAQGGTHKPTTPPS